jgi:autotransporter translocation and assembly factor TamB
MNDDERTRRSWRARAARPLAYGVLAAFVLAAFIVGLLHLPPVRRSVTEAAVRKASSALGGNLRTGEVRWSLFTGTLDARNLLVRGEGDRAGTEISVARLHARLSLAAFVRGRIVLEEVVVEQPRALLALDANGRLLHPLHLPQAAEGTTAERPDVDVRSFRLSGGRIEIVDRGPARNHVALADVALDGSLRLRDLTSKGTLTFPSIELSAAGKEPLRGSTLSARWETKRGAGSASARLEAGDAGLVATLDATFRDLEELPGWEAKLVAKGTLDALGERLAPDLGLRGSVEAQLIASGKGAGLPKATATARAEGLTLLGRSFDSVVATAESDGTYLRKGTLDVSSGRGRLHAEASGTFHPEPADASFSIRADGLDLAKLLPGRAGGTRLEGTLDGTVEGTLARAELAALVASADLSVRGSGTRGRHVLSPDARLRARVAKGIVTLSEAKLTDRRTRAALEGVYDHVRGTFQGKADVESGDIGPYLGLFGVAGNGELSVRLAGGGPLARPALDGRLSARSLSIAGARIDRVELDARSRGARVDLTNGVLATRDLSAGFEADGTLPLPGVEAPAIDLLVRGARLRGRPLPDLDARASLGPDLAARLSASDGSLSASASAPAAGGFRAEATFDRFDLAPFAAYVPPHVTGFDGRLTGRLLARRGRAGPLEATLAVDEAFVTAAGRRFTATGAGATARGGRFEIPGLEIRGDDGALLSVAGGGAADATDFDLRVRFEVPELARYEAFLPYPEEGKKKEPIGGRVSGDLAIAGSLEKPRVTGELRASDLVAFGAALKRLDVTLSPAAEGRVAAAARLGELTVGAWRLEGAKFDAVLSGNDVSAEGEAFDGRLRLRATGSLAGPRPFDATLSLDALDLAALFRAAGGPADLAGTATGTVRVHGSASDLSGLGAEVNLATFEAKHPRWGVRAEEPVRVVVAGGRLDVRSLRLSGSGLALEASGSLPLEGRGAGGLSVVSSLDLGFLLPFVDDLDRASGRLSARLDVSGSLASPVAAGTVTLEDGLLDGPDLPSPLEGLTGTVTLAPDRLRTDRLAARIGGGSVVLAGSVGLEKGRPAGTVDATIRGRDVELEVNPDLMVRADADLTARGEWRALVLGGQVRIEEAVYVPAFDLAGLLSSFTERARRPPPPVELSPWLPRLSFDLAVLARDAIRVEGDLGDADLGGSFRVKGTLDHPVVLGSLSSSRGTVNAFGTRFDISRAELEFKGRAGIDPDLDVLATTARGEEEITVRVDGRASRAQLILSSSKGRSHTEIVSVLFGGSGEGGPGLAAAAGRMALRSAATPILGALGAHTDLVIVPLPTTPEGEQFLFSVGKELGGGLSATYFKGSGGETDDAFELRLRLGSKERGRLRQNQDGSLSGGLRIRHDLD